MATSTNPEILNGHSLSTTQWSYGKTKVNKSGGKNVPLRNTATKKTLYLSTPLMLTWGVNENDYDGSGKFSYDMSLQFPREQDSNFNDATKGFLSGLQELESQIKADAITNSKEWFNKSKMSAEVVDALWSPMLKYSKFPKGHMNEGEFDYDKPPRLQVKVPCYEGIWKAELYDDQQNRLFPNVNEPTVTPLDFIIKGSKVATLIQCGGIWFANGKFGVTWKLVQAVIKPRETLFGRCHIALSTADKERLKVAEEVEQDLQDAVVESDEEEEVEVAPPVVEPKKKKVVRKKNATVDV